MQAGISKMDGIGGRPAWSWIFSAFYELFHSNNHMFYSVIEGLVTVVAGALSFLIIQDFPDTAKFLTEEERVFVVRRLLADDQHSAGGENLKWKSIVQSLKDWKTWISSMPKFYVLRGTC